MPHSRPPPSTGSPLLLPALEALAGAVLRVDLQQRVTAATPEARARLDPAPIPPGTPLAEVLSVSEGARGLEALLSHGRQVEAWPGTS
ncbi:MAG TPA: hypothetical protein VEU33_50405, partial [Archangium sp.]|nr:hypothetical protein [Archangium sp.]